MAPPLMSLVNDESRYQKSFQLFLERSSEHQCMRDFIHRRLPDILASIGDGKSNLNVIGVGSGAGEIDLEMLSELHLKHPGVTVDNEVVEPSSQQLHNYKVLVSQKQDLDYLKFTWNKMTASEFEQHWKAKKMTKKADFIHMVQMLYYVKDLGATITFFHNLLNKNGKLLIILVSGESGWGKLWRTYREKLCNTEISQCVTTGDIKSFLDSKGVSYQSYELPSQLDITECFIEGDEKGELLLDFLTEGSFMATEAKQTCSVQSFQLYLEKSGEHKAILQCVPSLLPEFKSLKSLLWIDVFTLKKKYSSWFVPGELDVQMLSVLQSAFPALPITADIVEGSSQLSDNFKAPVAQTANLQKIPFTWHITRSEDYEKQVKTKADVKKFDFIHMIQVSHNLLLNKLDNFTETIKFYHSLLKNNGRLMIIFEKARGGWDTLWKTYEKELCVATITEYHSSAKVVVCLQSLGLKYEEHTVHNTFDITECFDTTSATGERLLNFMTARDHFYQSFTPEIRAGILGLLKNKCSTEKDGRVIFDSNLSCMLIYG